MIVTEFYMTRKDGMVLNRTYSDRGMMIERDGVRYAEAVDPADLHREYIETDEPIATDPQDYARKIPEMEKQIASLEAAIVGGI